MKRIFPLYIFVLFSLTSSICFSQTIFYQDIFKGGVTGGGYTATTGQGTGSFTLNIPSGSSIKYAYLLAGCYGSPDQITVLLNSTPIAFSQSNKVSNNVYSPYTGMAGVHGVNLKNIINPNISDYTISIPQQQNPVSSERYTDFYLIVGYENSNLEKINSVITINNKDFSPNLNYNINGLNTIDITNQVGLALMSGFICDTILDGTEVIVNNMPIGLIGGANYNSSNGCGVFGFFYHQNNQLFGLGNSISNNNMIGNDGIADISPYLSSQSSIAILYKQQEQTSPAGNDNSIWANFLNYTTPCDTFTSSITQDTTICFGETLKLQATGGQSYEWSAMTNSPSTINDLSCTDCPNPIFSGDSSRVYTVKIWNTDSCSVVKPISIGVSHPQKLSVSTNKSICSFSTGKIIVQDVPDNTVQLGAVNQNGDTLNPASGNVFVNLSAGDYTVFYVDKFGCNSDTLVYVEPIIDTEAAFYANPKSGTAPIQINLTNQSENATDYSWWINDVYQGNQLSGFFTDTSGTFEIELIAFRNDSICADTASFTLFIFDSLIVGLPNVFTPNNDGVNDFFNVKVNLPVAYKLNILNRWGNVIFENEGDLTKGEHKIWNGETKSGEIVTDGTYFYKIAFGLDRESIDCELTDCEVVKQGFVQVVNK